MIRLYFTCSKDYERALVSAQFNPAERTIFAISEGDPLPDVGDSQIEIIRTNFPRNRNLNGKECVRGIHSLVSKLGQPVLKCDSDTLILRPELFLPETVIGTRRENTFWGCCYSITPEVSKKVVELIDSGWWDEFFKPSISVGEDIALMYALNRLRIKPQLIDNGLGWGKREPDCVAIHCHRMSAEEMRNLYVQTN